MLQSCLQVQSSAQNQHTRHANISSGPGTVLFWSDPIAIAFREPIVQLPSLTVLYLGAARNAQKSLAKMPSS